MYNVYNIYMTIIKVNLIMWYSSQCQTRMNQINLCKQNGTRLSLMEIIGYQMVYGTQWESRMPNLCHNRANMQHDDQHHHK